jgi:signal transduction histidine kinase
VDRQTVELAALGFQVVVTALLAAVYWGLWRQERRVYFATWAAAWAVYAFRLAFISAYLVERRDVWLFAHQAAAGLTALLLLGAALQFSGGWRWRRGYAALALLPIAWAFVSIYGIHSERVAGGSTVVLLSWVTLWTGWIFWRLRARAPSAPARVLAATFTLWGLHHLDYPLLRFLGAAVLFGVLADVIFITVAAVATLFLVLEDRRRALEARGAELEQLTHLLLKTQEEERRRVARELHDEAGQVLTAVKIELDLEGRREASEKVARALGRIRDLSNLLRPDVLDDLGLLPALHGLVEDFGERTRIRARLEAPERVDGLSPDHEVALYRVVQEALTNVARHADAKNVTVRVARAPGAVRLTVEDDGRGAAGEPSPKLGLLGIRERVAALGGTLRITGAPGAGLRIEAQLPVAG